MDCEPTCIRRYRPDDLDSLHRVCLQTADIGQDATPLFHYPELPGHVYVGPYVTFEPSLVFVAEDAAGIGGYIVAALDSQAFEQRLEQDWWPALRARYPEPSQDVADDLSLPERYALHDIHHPWDTDPTWRWHGSRASSRRQRPALMSSRPHWEGPVPRNRALPVPCRALA